MTNFRAAIVPVTPFQQNCTLVWSDASKIGAVVDPGGDLERVKAAIAELGITVEAILLTHGHVDHAGGATELAADLGVDIVGPHEADRFLLESLAETGAGYGMMETRNVTPDRWLGEGDSVEVGDLVFEVRHCPGHSPGSVAFVNEDARVVLSGDVLFCGSVGRTDLPGGDHEALIRSIRNRLLPLGNDYAFVCGHGPTGTLGEERLTNPFLR